MKISYTGSIKPLIDFIVAFLGFLILSPFFLVVIIILLFTNGSNPFFFQGRPGKNGKIFKLIKFKTMNDKRDSNGSLLPDADRLTAVGSFVRKTSLDEIPQLLNVIKGDMSLIGPRPLLPEYLNLYNESQKRRHDVKPGITGWAQVNGRNAISWQKKFEYDVWYVDHISLGLDCRIVWMTVLKVFRSEGINQNGHATMTKFEGN